MPFDLFLEDSNPKIGVASRVQFVSNCQGTKSNKLHLDKYYTPDWVARKCIEIANEVVGADNITEYFEPSAGKGVFVDELQATRKPVFAVDIEPEADGIETQDFLRMVLPYRAGRMFIGNPRLVPEISCLSSSARSASAVGISWRSLSRFRS